jgi:hypothetical protein
MILKVIIDDQTHEIKVPDALLTQARAFFDRLDQDMNGGWQMSREWVEAPDRLQRCQIVADKLLTALESGNGKLGAMMAGYILTRLPEVASVELDIQGEMQNHRLHLVEPGPVELRPMELNLAEASVVRQPDPAAVKKPGLSKLEAMEQAGNDVTQVFRVGRGYRFATFDHAVHLWRDSPLTATEQEAARLRQESFKTRYEELLRGLSH